MDLFKTQFERIQKQLAALTPSQRMLTGALVAIMVMTLVWWGRYAGDPEMEALLPQAIGQDDLPRVIGELDAKGIKHAMGGDGKVLVPADRRVEAVAVLYYTHTLPRNASKDGFDEVIKSINPFWSEKQSAEMWNRGKEMTAAQIIRDFPDIAECRVMIDPKRERRIEGGTEPSAIVTITTHSGAGKGVPQQLVDAAADVVQGAQSTLARSRIKVVVDGIPRKLKQDAALAGAFGDPGDQLLAMQSAEVHFENKIRDQFAYIPNLMVSVTVKVNTTTSEEREKTFDPKNVVQKETEIHNRTQESSGTSSAGGGEPGVSANTGLSVPNDKPSTAAGGPVSSTQDEQTKFENHIGEKESHRATPAGEATPVSAALRVPLAYFSAIYKQRNPSVKDPSDDQLRPLVELEMVKIKRGVMAMSNLKTPDDVVVETYVDPTPVVVAATTPATAGLSTALLSSGHVKEVVLGALALVSLFMVSGMVKRGAAATVLAGATSSGSTIPPGTPILELGAQLVGAAGETGSMLDGMELDDESVRTQQMLDQVSSLVKESPDSAATLIKRWMNK